MDCSGAYAVNSEVTGNGKELTLNDDLDRRAGVHSDTKQAALPEVPAGYSEIWRWGWYER